MHFCPLHSSFQNKPLHHFPLCGVKTSPLAPHPFLLSGPAYTKTSFSENAQIFARVGVAFALKAHFSESAGQGAHVWRGGRLAKPKWQNTANSSWHNRLFASDLSFHSQRRSYHSGASSLLLPPSSGSTLVALHLATLGTTLVSVVSIISA